ncbi:hypothetical protein K5I29_05125 [Flavobacterium agricola]|uniref:Outer membrane protein beta-barrel domain-containing protein n=1 Tax=Flavobacterium agricola TaxID=2870839 RepID=A0ABY6M158_9FLAO|nr:hypothetical protein [Flavobacterium agricola]UYW02285.1 hypothetical protein K5I29_05125 [Flavobacterium agricola]
MKKITTFLALVAASTSLFAQDYDNSIGLRFGSGYYDAAGIAFKTFVSRDGAIEADLGFKNYSRRNHNWTNVSVSGTYQHHFPIGNVENFKWFVGGGIVFANSFSNHSDREGFNMGIYPTGGVEYKLKNAPFVFSADIRPTIHVVEAYDYYNNAFFNTGITARYTF